MAPRNFRFGTLQEERAWFKNRNNNNFATWAGKPVGKESSCGWNALRDIIGEVNGITVQELLEVFSRVLAQTDLGTRGHRPTKDAKSKAQAEVVKLLMEKRRQLVTKPAHSYKAWLEKAIDVYLPRSIHVYRHYISYHKYETSRHKSNHHSKKIQETAAEEDDTIESRVTRSAKQKRQAVFGDEGEESEESEHQSSLSPPPPDLQRNEVKVEPTYIKISDSPEPEPLHSIETSLLQENLNLIPQYSAAESSILSSLSRDSESIRFKSSISTYSTPPPKAIKSQATPANKFNIRVELRENPSGDALKIQVVSAKLILKKEYTDKNLADITGDNLDYEKLMERVARPPLSFQAGDELGWIQPGINDPSAAYFSITDEWDFQNALTVLRDEAQPVVLHIVRKPQPPTMPLNNVHRVTFTEPPYPKSDVAAHVKQEPDCSKQQKGAINNIFPNTHRFSRYN